MKVLKGTKFKLESGVEITLESQATISFPNSAVEETQVGFLQNTGNWETNKDLYKFNRDENGRILPIEDQLADGQTAEQFVDGLSAKDAALFGIEK